MENAAFIVDHENPLLPLAGAYLIRNTVNGKCYVGISQNIRKRLAGHARGKGYAPVLAKAICKYGAAAFEAVPLFYSTSGTDYLPIVEEHLIRDWGGLTHGYNVQAASGSVGPYGPLFSAVVREAHASKEVKAKHSAGSKAWRQSEAGRAHTAASLAATQSPEAKAKRAASMAAWRNTPEARAISSAAGKARYAAVGDKMRTGLQEVRATPEGRAKMSAAAVARMASPEMRARVSAATRATMADPEWKKMRSEVSRAVHARPGVKEKKSATLRATFSDPQIRAKVSASKIGRVWITDGHTSRCVYPDAPIPDGWRRGKCK